jgi:hypothetical protein
MDPRKGGEGAVMEKEDSVKGILRCLRGLKVEDSGNIFKKLKNNK